MFNIANYYRIANQNRNENHLTPVITAINKKSTDKYIKTSSAYATATEHLLNKSEESRLQKGKPISLE